MTKLRQLLAKIAKVGIALSTMLTTGAFAAVTAFAEDAEETTDASCSWSYLILLILLFVIMYFILVRPQRKKEKEAKAMQSSIQVGDEIVTIGGIVGIVVQVTEDTIVIETSGNRNKVRLKSWSVQENVTVSENKKREQEEKLAAAKAKREKKGKKKGKEDTPAETTDKKPAKNDAPADEKKDEGILKD